MPPFLLELLLTKSVFVVHCFSMRLNLKDFFRPRKQVVADEVQCQPCPRFVPIGEVSLEQMLQLRDENKYFFHGSPVKLEPGTDMLRPSTKSGVRGQGLVFAGLLNDALRFAMVRTWGVDQECGKDFFVYVSKSYRIVISSAEIGVGWRNSNVPAYIYAVPREMITKEETSINAVPIVARAMVTPNALRKNGFVFAVDVNPETTSRWWWVANQDKAIKEHVLTDKMLRFEKQR